MHLLFRTQLEQESKTHQTHLPIYGYSERIGKLLGISLKNWLDRDDLNLSERAKAYDLLPTPLPEPDSSITQVSTRIVLKAFQREIEGKPILLCMDGTVEDREDTIAFPIPVLDAWSPKIACDLFAPSKSKVLSCEITRNVLIRLQKWNLVEKILAVQILKRLENTTLLPPPCPDSVEKLLPVWSFLEKHVAKDWEFREWWTKAAIVPVDGHDVLGRGNDLLPARNCPTNCSEEDWNFLIKYVDLLDDNFRSLLNNFEEDREVARQLVQESLGKKF